MTQKEIFVIFYNNGESYDDHWSGVNEHLGAFETRELAEEEIKKLQIAHDFRVKEEIAQGYTFPSHEKESWKVISIKYITLEEFETPPKVEEMLPKTWLFTNYGVVVNSKVTIFSTKEEKKIMDVKKTDNIGHFRTNYPVVIGFTGESMLLKDSTNWLTIEEVFGY